MQKLIKLSNTHYIVIDDSEIQEGDWVYKIQHSHTSLFYVDCEELADDFNRNKDNYKKITHSTEPLEMQKMNSLGSHFAFVKIKELSLSEVEESINGYSVEKLAENHIKENETSFDNWKEIAYTRVGYIEGFKAHQEFVKDKLFTLDDMKRFLAKTIENAPSTESHTEMISNKAYRHHVLDVLFDNLIQHFLPKTEWDITIDEQITEVENKITELCKN